MLFFCLVLIGFCFGILFGIYLTECADTTRHLANRASATALKVELVVEIVLALKLRREVLVEEDYLVLRLRGLFILLTDYRMEQTRYELKEYKHQSSHQTTTLTTYFERIRSRCDSPALRLVLSLQLVNSLLRSAFRSTPPIV